MGPFTVQGFLINHLSRWWRAACQQEEMGAGREEYREEGRKGKGGTRRCLSSERLLVPLWARPGLTRELSQTGCELAKFFTERSLMLFQKLEIGANCVALKVPLICWFVMVCVMPLTWLPCSHPHWCFVWAAESCWPSLTAFVGRRRPQRQRLMNISHCDKDFDWVVDAVYVSLVICFCFVFQSFSGFVSTVMAEWQKTSSELSQEAKHYLWECVPCVNVYITHSTWQCLLVGSSIKSSSDASLYHIQLKPMDVL